MCTDFFVVSNSGMWKILGYFSKLVPLPLWIDPFF